MSRLRPKSQTCLPIKAIPWLLTANARNREGLKEGVSRPIHSYSRLGHRVALETVSPMSWNYPTLLIQSLNNTPIRRTKTTDIKVATQSVSLPNHQSRELRHRLSISSPRGIIRNDLDSHQLTKSQINLSDYIGSQGPEPVKSRTACLQIMRKRHNAIMKRQLKRGPSLLKMKVQDVYLDPSPNDVLVFQGGNLPKKKEEATIPVSWKVIRKRLSLGYTGNGETKGNEKGGGTRTPVAAPEGTVILAKGEQISLKPKKGRIFGHFIL